jgi:hypothetical protein
MSGPEETTAVATLLNSATVNMSAFTPQAEELITEFLEARRFFVTWELWKGYARSGTVRFHSEQCRARLRVLHDRPVPPFTPDARPPQAYWPDGVLESARATPLAQLVVPAAWPSGDVIAAALNLIAEADDANHLLLQALQEIWTSPCGDDVPLGDFLDAYSAAVKATPPAVA